MKLPKPFKIKTQENMLGSSRGTLIATSRNNSGKGNNKITRCLKNVKYCQTWKNNNKITMFHFLHRFQSAKSLNYSFLNMGVQIAAHLLLTNATLVWSSWVQILGATCPLVACWDMWGLANLHSLPTHIPIQKQIVLKLNNV